MTLVRMTLLRMTLVSMTLVRMTLVRMTCQNGKVLVINHTFDTLYIALRYICTIGHLSKTRN